MDISCLVPISMVQQMKLKERQKSSEPMYVPSMAVLGVLKPSPTSLNHLRPPFPALVLLVLFAFELTKI